MIQFLKSSWWKYVCAALLIYVLVGGMLTPLGSGITAIQPFQATTNQTVTYLIKGKNTHFAEAKDLQLWAKVGLSDFYKVNDYTIWGNDEISCRFALGSSLLADNKKAVDIVMNNSLDGTVILRDAIAFNISSDSLSVTKNLIKESVEVKSNKAQTFSFPYREILYESIRNTFYHVPMWFTMTLLLIISFVYSMMYLSKNNMQYDFIASEAVSVALVFGYLGLATGMMWANYTWGSPWPNDWKLNGAAIGVLIYLAYQILRGSIDDEIKRAKISAVYNIFSIVIFILFIFIIPRITASLHPGNGGNPAFSKYDLDSHMRLFFYPAVIGWILLGLWFLSIKVRMKIIESNR